MTFNNTLINCTTAPMSAPSDAGVAGAGILLAFIVTAGLALSLSCFIVFSELHSQPSPHTIARQVLNGLSDQQLIEGIAIQVIGLARYRRILPYHFFIVWMLALLSTATNFAALLALVQDFKRDWVLRWMRQSFMFVNLVLTIVYGIIVLETNVRALAPTLPVACVWEEHAEDANAQGNGTLSIIGTIAVMAASCIVFALGTWYLQMRGQWVRFLRIASLLAMAAIAIGATLRVLLISQAFGHPSVPLSDEGEKEWNFGQLLTMLLLILPFIGALEIFRGQVQVTTPNFHLGASSDAIPLTSTDDRNDFSKLGNKPAYAFRVG